MSYPTTQVTVTPSPLPNKWEVWHYGRCIKTFTKKKAAKKFRRWYMIREQRRKYQIAMRDTHAARRGEITAAVMPQPPRVERGETKGH